MNNHLVSVIVPIYNAKKYLEETIESILNQTYKNIEILLINHNSTDDSISIINHYKKNDNRIKVISLDVNKGGPAYPRNIGIENSKGKYIAFLDSDDVWMKNKLFEQIKFMEDNNLNFTSTRAIVINEESKINILSYFKNFIRLLKKKNHKTFIKYNFIYLSSVIIDKNILIDFNEENNCIAVEDFYLWLQILNKENTEYAYFEKVLLKYRLLKNSASERNIKGKQLAKASYYLYKYILDNNKFELMDDIK